MDLETLLGGVVIPVDKPRQWTSFQAVTKVKSTIRNLYGVKKFKIGHAGTLDPLATGLLLVCVGKATKRIAQLQEGEKVYSGTMVLGATTPCYDLERPVDAYYPYKHITFELLDETRKQFVGDIRQVPPVFSAVKIEGERAYRLAQAMTGENGDEMPSPTPKTVQVREFQITAFRQGMPEVSFSSSPTDSMATASHLYKSPLGEVPTGLPQVDFRIRCGKGTYIRSIARDFGTAMGSGAFLSALRREQVGEYTIAEAVGMENIESFFKS